MHERTHALPWGGEGGGGGGGGSLTAAVEIWLPHLAPLSLSVPPQCLPAQPARVSVRKDTR